MLRLFSIAVALLLGCGIANAQSASGMPAIGATSPLGTLGSTSPGLPAGIPLGATEIDPGGLSPMPLGAMGNSFNCLPNTPFSGLTPGAGSGTNTTGTFDGGGVNPSASASGSGATPSACVMAPSATTSSTGLGSPLSTPGASVGSSLAGGTIPLGSTEIGGAGISPMIVVPMPSTTPTTCTDAASSTVTAGTSGLAAGSTSPTVPLGTIGTGAPGLPSGC